MKRLMMRFFGFFTFGFNWMCIVLFETRRKRWQENRTRKPSQVWPSFSGNSDKHCCPFSSFGSVVLWQTRPQAFQKEVVGGVVWFFVLLMRVPRHLVRALNSAQCNGWFLLFSFWQWKSWTRRGRHRKD